MWATSRWLLYIAAIAAGGLELSGYATFDAENLMLDIHPFNVQEFVITLGQTAANVMAAVAVWSGWAGKKNSPKGGLED